MVIDDDPTPSFVPALFIVDMQHDFVYGSLAVPGAEAIIDAVNEILSLPGFRLKVATQDFHPPNHISFASTHDKPVFSTTTIYHPEDDIEDNGIEQVLWPDHCVANTAGANFVEGLKVHCFHAIVRKGTHPDIESYSPFRDIWTKYETELPFLLSGEDITDVFIVGLAGDYCVKHTALDAMQYGFETWLVTDAIKCISDGQEAYREMKQQGAFFVTLEEVKQKLASST